MSGQSGHITSKVVLGYLLLVLITVCSVVYIYNIIEQFAGEDNTDDNLSREKVYLVTNTLSLLYESEALGQIIGRPNGEMRHFNRTLNKALQNMDSLRVLVSNEELLLKIDTIEHLIEQKRWNTRRLLETWKETDTENLYAQNIEKMIAQQDTVIRQVEVQQRVIVRQDSVKSSQPRERRGFFRRLADAFSPPEEDSTVVINTTQQIVTDTLVSTFYPADTIMTVLKNLQDSVADQRKQIVDRLLERAANLRYNNSIITSRINQILRDIEEDEVNLSMARVMKKQAVIRETSYLIAGIALLSFVIGIVFIVLIARDVSRSQYFRKQLEKAKLYAEDLLRRREKLMLTISHDIRAPLSSIIGYIELLTRRHPEDERQQYYLDNMKGSSDHIFSLVNGLLDFHRLESGQMEIQNVPFSVCTLFNEIYGSFRPLAEAKGLSLFLDMKEDGEMERLYAGDPIRLRQVVSNLLSNAIKFTHEGRVLLRVRYIVADHELVIVVSDSGTGIPEAEQEKIFGEFTRLSGTEKAEGFGLGLSITRKLIELMHGTLTLKSLPGKGSDFTIVLPLEESEIQTLPVEQENRGEEDKTFEGREIYCLLIDDDPLQLALTEEFLKRNHVEVASCTAPSAVVDMLRNTTFDAIITDIQMPGLDGYGLLKAIRTSGIPGTETVPIIALSASIENEHTHYLEAGFTGFLNKPFTARQLIALLNSLLQADIQPEAVPTFNFDSLTAFAGEDKEASASIICTFAEETRKSISLLQEALDSTARADASRVAHKLIPLFTMLGATGLVAQLRMLEKNDESLTDDGWHRLLNDVIRQATQLVEQAVERCL